LVIRTTDIHNLWCIQSEKPPHVVVLLPFIALSDAAANTEGVGFPLMPLECSKMHRIGPVGSLATPLPPQHRAGGLK